MASLTIRKLDDAVKTYLRLRIGFNLLFVSIT